MKHSFLLIALFALSGCPKTPVATDRTDNGGFNVERLFTHEGCTVYRFRDTRLHYYTDCRGRTTSAYTEYCGKGCTRTLSDEIETSDDPR